MLLSQLTIKPNTPLFIITKIKSHGTPVIPKGIIRTDFSSENKHISPKEKRNSNNRRKHKVNASEKNQAQRRHRKD